MALIYRWFTWVYLLKMGGFSMAPKQSIHQVQVGQSVPEPEKVGHVGHGEARYSQYSYIACKCPSSKWQFIMTDRYLWHLMALMFGYVLPRPEFHYFCEISRVTGGFFILGTRIAWIQQTWPSCLWMYAANRFQSIISGIVMVVVDNQILARDSCRQHLQVYFR